MNDPLTDFLEQEVAGGPWQLHPFDIGGGDESKLLATDAGGRAYFVKVGGMTQPAVALVAGEIGLAPPLVAGGVLADGRAISVQPFIVGETADAAWLGAHQSQTAAMLRTLGTSEELRAVLAPIGGGGLRTRARLRHGILDSWYSDIADSGWPGLARVRAVLDQLQGIAETLPADGPPVVAVHADPQPANWRVGVDGRLYLTDWETARLDEWVTDPARVAIWCVPFEERAEFITTCGLDARDPSVHALAHWQTTQYFAGIVLWVVKRNRPARGDHFLQLSEHLLRDGLWRS